jgi:anti-sigma factor RsiW
MPTQRLVSLWRWLNLPCREFARLTSEALDRPLSRPEKCALQIHLLSCVACRRYARQVRFLRDALQRLSHRLDHDDSPLPGPDLPQEARQRIKSLLEINQK